MVKDALFAILSAELRLSKHFSIKEFFVSTCAVTNNIDNVPPTYKKLTEVLSNLHKLAQTLELIRASNGNAPIYITSGYRCPKLNELVNGAFYSTHKDGLAADITCKDIKHLAESIEWLELPVYWYANYEKNYIHINLKL